MDSIQGFHENTSKKLDPHDEMFTLEADLDCPFIYLHELQNMLLQATGTNVMATICKLLHSQGSSHKKLAFGAQQRSDAICIGHFFVWTTRLSVDETGSDKRSLLRKYGYAFKGSCAITEKPLVKGKWHSAIAAMWIDGVSDVQITTESVNGETFCEYRRLPQLLPYNGVNSRSVVILDNASIHHVESTTRNWSSCHISPSLYSPDYMPTEQCFSKRVTWELMIQ